MAKLMCWASYCLGFLLLSLPGTFLFADELTLKDGRKINGTVVKKNGDTLVVELSAGNMVLVSSQELKGHSQNAKGEAAYAEALKAASDTVESHIQMAGIAQKNQLPEHARAHYERVIELDSEHQAARAALGQVKVEGMWIERDTQMREGRGKISVGGRRYRFPEYVAMQEAQEKFNSQRTQLANEIKRAVKDLNNPRNSAKGQAVLDGLEGPLASAAINYILYPKPNAVFKTNISPATKALFLPILERLGDPGAVQTLIRMCLDVDQSPEQLALRQQAIGILKKLSPEDAFNGFMGALNSSDNATVNLAGELLQELNDDRAIVPLIDRLLSFRRVETGGGQQTNAGMFGDGSVGFSRGDPKIVKTEAIQNPGVLGALVSITGQNNGYDRGKWLEWYDREYIGFSGDLRRDK